MFVFDKIPEFIYELFESRGAAKDRLMLIMRCDMNSEYEPSDTYLAATDECLYKLSGTQALSGESGRIENFWDEQCFEKYPLSDIENIKAEELLSGTRLVITKTSGEVLNVTAMSNFCKTNVEIFIKYLKKIQKGDIKTPDFEIAPEDDPKKNSCPKCGMRYPDRNRKICPRCMEKGKLYKRFSVFLFKYKKDLFIMLLSLVLLTATGILIPYFSNGFFFDNVLEKGGKLYGQVLAAVSIVVAMQVLSRLADIVNGYVSTKISAKIVYDLKNTIFGAIQKLSMNFFSGRQTGSLMTQVGNDSNSIYSFFCDVLPYFVINIVQVVVLCVILFVMNPILATVCLLPVPVFFVLIRQTFATSKKLRARNYSGTRTINAHLSDVLGGIRVVKAFAKENDEMSRFHGSNSTAAQYSKRLSLYNKYVPTAISFVLYFGNIAALGLGGYMVMISKLSYGELITFIAYVNMIYTPLQFFANMSDWTASCTNALSRLYELYDAEPDISEREDAINPEKIEGRVEFKNVDFAYVRGKKVLSDVSFEVKPGKTLGIVGHTGAGKSTIANLIMRLYDTDEGSVTIDGINVKDLAFAALYKNIALVSQETFLFMGSIMDNIRYAKPDASYIEVITAAKNAGAHDFIVKLPDGYNTVIGAGGKSLSGGERQRLSIARAILCDPKILILDEATAAMDTKTEKIIQAALKNLTRSKTTIMIAHRLSTLKDADSLVVIENGKVAEMGTHAELLAKEDGVYNKLYTLQLEALRNAGIAE